MVPTEASPSSPDTRVGVDVDGQPTVLGYYSHPRPRGIDPPLDWRSFVAALVGFYVGIAITASLATAGFVAGDLVDRGRESALTLLGAILFAAPGAVFAYRRLGSVRRTLTEAICVGALIGMVIVVLFAIVIVVVQLVAGPN